MMGRWSFGRISQKMIYKVSREKWRKTGTNLAKRKKRVFWLAVDCRRLHFCAKTLSAETLIPAFQGNRSLHIFER